jgi:hypothetical protein
VAACFMPHFRGTHSSIANHWLYSTAVDLAIWH